jgi:hypothetical protein
VIPSFNPCGRGVDMLRSCYTADVRFFRDDPRTTKIVWSFCDDQSNVLPFETFLYSRNWDDNQSAPEGVLGEVLGGSRPWRDGTPPYPVAAGAGVCGTAEQFKDGESVPPDPPPPVNVFGGPSCCPIPPHPFIHFSCSRCPKGASSDYAMKIEGAGVLYYVLLNGLHRFTYVGNCQWQTERFPRSIPPDPDVWFQYTMLMAGPAGSISLSSDQGFLGTPYISLPTDCLTRFVKASVHNPFPPIGIIFPVAGTATIMPGDPFAGSFNCPTSGGVDKASYTVEIENLGLVGPTLKPGFYPLANTAPCVWTGQISAHQRGTQGWTEGIGFSAFLTIDSSIKPILTLKRPLRFGGFGTATYSGTRAWDLNSTTALDRDATAGGSVDWPTTMRLWWPGNP